MQSSPYWFPQTLWCVRTVGFAPWPPGLHVRALQRSGSILRCLHSAEVCGSHLCPGTFRSVCMPHFHRAGGCSLWPSTKKFSVTTAEQAPTSSSDKAISADERRISGMAKTCLALPKGALWPPGWRQLLSHAALLPRGLQHGREACSTVGPLGATSVTFDTAYIFCIY